MARTPKVKELINTRLACAYGGWIYCDSCNETIGYLCYVTYESFYLEYKCKCKSCGSMYISFGDNEASIKSDSRLITVKNRLCCPDDKAPLFTILAKKLDSYKYEAVCKECNKIYTQESE